MHLGYKLLIATGTIIFPLVLDYIIPISPVGHPLAQAIPVLISALGLIVPTLAQVYTSKAYVRNICLSLAIISVFTPFPTCIIVFRNLPDKAQELLFPIILLGLIIYIPLFFLALEDAIIQESVVSSSHKSRLISYYMLLVFQIIFLPLVVSSLPT